MKWWTDLEDRAFDVALLVSGFPSNLELVPLEEFAEAADIVGAWTLFYLFALSQLIPCIVHQCLFTKRKRAIEDAS